jgi:hypothetical protein
MSEDLQRLLGALEAGQKALEERMRKMDQQFSGIYKAAFAVGFGSIGIIVSYLLKKAGLM